MQKGTQLKGIGLFLGLWGSIRLARLGTILTSSTQADILFIGIDAVTGLILLAGSAGILLKKNFGFYLGTLGIMAVLGVNTYNLAAGAGQNIIALLINITALYYLTGDI